jgi:predicted NUDIX family NTP pyrophosphohydrolase
MPGRSAGILVYRLEQDAPRVLLVHPGGPFWARKDDASWSIPKGLVESGEDPLAAARRELLEETGLLAEGDFRDLGEIRQASGKIVHAWAVEGRFDVTQLVSNTFSVEWPPHSGKKVEFPEVDRAEWFDIETAGRKINPGQAPLLSRLVEILG